MLRRVVIGVSASLIALVAAGNLAFLYISRAPVVPSRPMPPDYATFALDACLGWYDLPGDTDGLVAWGPDGNLRMLTFGDRAAAEPVIPASAATAHWVRDKAPKTVIQFVRGADGEVTAMEWTEPDATRHRAPRLTSYPFTVTELSFENDGEPLYGNLFTPTENAPFPTAVLIHGSGANDRDNRWVLTLAHSLAVRGVAAFVPDKRGCGRSGGEWQTANFDLLARDAVAAVELVKKQPHIDPVRVGLVGLSQGGWIVPMACGMSHDLAFIVNVVGSAVTPKEQTWHETKATLAQNGLPAFLVPLVAPVAYRVPLRRYAEFWRKNGDYDPVRDWERMKCPVLVVYGALDERDNVPVAESVRRLEGARDRGGVDMTIQVYPDSGHALYEPNTTILRHDFRDLLGTWIKERVAASS
jgi:hypothetical protein